MHHYKRKESNEYMRVVLAKLIDEDVASIIFHFPPDILDFRSDSVEKSDTLLFIRGRFDLADLEFKFPVTAQT